MAKVRKQTASCVKKRPAAKSTVFAKKNPSARLLKKKPAARSVDKKPAAAIKNKDIKKKPAAAIKRNEIKQNEIKQKEIKRKQMEQRHTESLELRFPTWLQAVDANQMPSRFAYQVARHLNNVAGILVGASNIQNLIDEAADDRDRLRSTVGSVPGASHLIGYMADRLGTSFGHLHFDWFAELRFIYDHM